MREEELHLVSLYLVRAHSASKYACPSSFSDPSSDAIKLATSLSLKHPACCPVSGWRASQERTAARRTECCVSLDPVLILEPRNGKLEELLLRLGRAGAHELSEGSEA